MSGEIEKRLQALGHSLPQGCVPDGSFLPFKRDGDQVFLAGQTCEWNGEILHEGPVLAPGQQPADGRRGIDLETGRQAAQVCALNLLFHLKAACGGDLDRAVGPLRLGGFVNCLPGFDRSPAVVDGASDLFVALFGEEGRHARTAVGVSGLPGNAAVEVDAVFRLR